MATINFYDDWIRASSVTGIDLSTDTFIITLHNGSTFDASNTQYSQVGGTEIATGDGYTQQNKIINATTWSQNSGLTTFAGNNVIWTSTDPGSIGPASAAIVYDDTTTSNLLMCYIDFQGTETASNGAEFQILWNAFGIYQAQF